MLALKSTGLHLRMTGPSGSQPRGPLRDLGRSLLIVHYVDAAGKTQAELASWNWGGSRHPSLLPAGRLRRQAGEVASLTSSLRLLVGRRQHGGGKQILCITA